MQFRLLLGLVLLALPLTAQDECKLPPALNSAIAHQWYGWHVLRIADLTAEDQNLWTYARGRVCPGASQGHFLDVQSFAYAIAAVRGKQEVVLVARESASKWLLSVVMLPTRVNRFRVIWLAKPGVYTDKLTGRKAQAITDAIGFEEIGAGVTVFIRQRNRFVPVRMGE